MNAMVIDDDEVQVWELIGEELMAVVNDEQKKKHGLPPGFRFHPTDEELVTFYLVSKVFGGGPFCGVNILEVDLNRCEPWELPEVAKMGEREWYFFSLRDRKYPTGLRTNRSTGAGYWKATGKDREVHAAGTGSLVGMKKTLVFYKGRAPRGEKTKWVLHEYRLEGDYSCRYSCKEEWVICRIFNKSTLVERGAESHHKDTSNNNNNEPYYLDPCPSIQNNNILPPLPDLQTLDCPIQSLLQNNPFLHHHHNPNPNPNLCPLPSSINWGPPHYCTQQQHDEQSSDLISNWLDFAYLHNPAEFYELAFANLGGLAGSSSIATVHDDLCLLGPTNAPQFGPMVP